MVLELKVPDGADWQAPSSLPPVILSYVLSFVYVAICWNNHDHLLQTVTRVNGLNSLGQYASAFVAFAYPVCDRLDG